VEQDEGKAEKCSENDLFEGKRSRAILEKHMDLTPYIASFRPKKHTSVFASVIR
jgi:hypothetical protein